MNNEIEKIFGKGAKRSYTIVTNSWFKKHLNDSRPEIEFGVNAYNADGNYDGTIGLVTVVWDNITGRMLTPKIECYSDGWKVLASMSDVIQAISDANEKIGGDELTVEEFRAILDRCGFVNETKK